MINKRLECNIPLDELLAVCDDCDIVDIMVKVWPIHGKECEDDGYRPVKISACYCSPDVCVSTSCKCGNIHQVYPED